MARNRKRAKERRSRRPATGPASRPGVATARADRDRRDGERLGPDPELESEGLEETPAPIDHAAPDVELAEAQLAQHRPAPSDADDADTDTGEPDEESAAGELAAASPTAPARRGGTAHRLITFLQGSWRELQRVQWPDRRQVMQATGVVIGFVIVAGLYLGLADTVAGKLVNLILK
ncbi:MAG: preprotein translocase subunit SecE [Solirubrobacteraceae bacterium]|nr:preprotein translocase subunit SecE [Solirubrobacteraceae bacterium]